MKKFLLILTLILCCTVTGCAYTGIDVVANAIAEGIAEKVATADTEKAADTEKTVVTEGVTEAAAEATAEATDQTDAKSDAETAPVTDTETDITEDILAQFEEFTQIPRPSHHEEQISNFLLQWAKDHGFEVTQDEENNIIFDVPATEGMEDAPLTALQAHMDMVFAVKEGLELDPLTTKIVSKLDGNILSSDGNTSLGSDDGIGLAIILQICEGKMPHGPLRIFITTNEENGMTGAPAIDPEMLADVSYMINIDSEEEGKVTVSSVAGTNFIYEKTYEMTKPSAKNALLVEIKGLTGGHSGMDIDKQRGNANILLSAALYILFEKGIDPEIASFDGGTANNAISSSASAVICTEKKEEAEQLLNYTLQLLKDMYKDTDPDMEFSVTDTQVPEKVLSVKDTKDFAMLFSEIPDGVYTWSEEIENFPESSSNLGILKLEDGKLHSESYARSSSPEKKEEMAVIYRENAEKYGNVEAIVHKHSEAWAYNPDSRLLEITKEAYKNLFGKDIEVLAVHAGLECGTFAALKPGIDLISIGPTINNPHTINEVCHTDTIEPVWKLIEEILGRLDNKENEIAPENLPVAVDPAEEPQIDTTSEYALLQDIVAQIREKTDFEPKVAMILGSGLNNLADEMDKVATISYKDIKGLPVSTAPGHEGNFIFGYIEGVPTVIMQGRVHCYEGYSALQVVRPVRVMKMLGADTLVLTNSSGGVNKKYKGGEIMMITNQILYGVQNPLIGANIDELGDRFPDMKDAYDKNLQKIIRESAKEVGVKIKEGVYLQDTGPSYETSAEIKMLRTFGADAVGMSTGIEAVAARHMGMKVCGLSCVTCPPSDMSTGVLNEDVVNSQAEKMTEDLGKILKVFIRKLK